MSQVLLPYLKVLHFSAHSELAVVKEFGIDHHDHHPFQNQTLRFYFGTVQLLIELLFGLIDHASVVQVLDVAVAELFDFLAELRRFCKLPSTMVAVHGLRSSLFHCHPQVHSVKVVAVAESNGLKAHRLLFVSDTHSWSKLTHCCSELQKCEKKINKF